MAQGIPCDLAAISAFLKTFDDMESKNKIISLHNTPLTANLVTSDHKSHQTSSRNKRQRLNEEVN